MLSKCHSEVVQLCSRYALLRAGPVCRNVRVGYWLIELACREVVTAASDPLVRMIARRQLGL